MARLTKLDVYLEYCRLHNECADLYLLKNNYHIDLSNTERLKKTASRYTIGEIQKMVDIARCVIENHKSKQ